ncbi:MAG: hypothetical protein PUA69_07480 [Erysipelotrichaceae bacterium]|jgi:hypothetical protein|nr:hypothetical protein [Erysipelotrichaceae bacterium]
MDQNEIVALAITAGIIALIVFLIIFFLVVFSANFFAWDAEDEETNKH